MSTDYETHRQPVILELVATGLPTQDATPDIREVVPETRAVVGPYYRGFKCWLHIVDERDDTADHSPNNWGIYGFVETETSDGSFVTLFDAEAGVDELSEVKGWLDALIDEHVTHQSTWDRVVTAARAVGHLAPHLWSDLAGHFTCDEADAIAELLRALDADYAADGLLEAHADSDTEGDRHHRG